MFGWLLLLLVFFLRTVLHCAAAGVYSAKFRVRNTCSHTVWPAIRSDDTNINTTTHLRTTGFTLQPSESTTLDIPNFWAGSLWGRTGCAQNSIGAFSCVTGDCGSSTIECHGGNAKSPATQAKFNLNDPRNESDFLLRVSRTQTDYNIPMTVVRQGGIGGSCDESGCSVDLSGACPTAKEVKLIKSGGDVSASCKSGSWAISRSTVAMRPPIVRIRASPACTWSSLSITA